MRAPTRRLLGAAAATLVTVLTLTACGGSSPGGSAGSTDSASETSVATKFGSVKVPADPKRVVALGWGDAETALALGVQPVGASDWLGFGGEGVGPWAKGLYTSAPTIINTLEPDYEAIATLKPDLILDTKSSGDQKRYERLASIAPTVGVPQGGDSYLTTTEQQMTMISQALHQEAKGKELLAGVDSELAAAASANPQFKGTSITVNALTSDGWSTYARGDARVGFMEKLGFQLADGVASNPSKDFSIPVAAEKLDTVDADVVVAFPIFIDAGKIDGDAAWKALPAVKAGHDVVLSDANLVNAYSLGTTLALGYAVDNVVPLLQKAV